MHVDLSIFDDSSNLAKQTRTCSSRSASVFVKPEDGDGPNPGERSAAQHTCAASSGVHDRTGERAARAVDGAAGDDVRSATEAAARGDRRAKGATHRPHTRDA